METNKARESVTCQIKHLQQQQELPFTKEQEQNKEKSNINGDLDLPTKLEPEMNKLSNHDHEQQIEQLQITAGPIKQCNNSNNNRSSSGRTINRSTREQVSTKEASTARHGLGKHR